MASPIFSYLPKSILDVENKRFKTFVIEHLEIKLNFILEKYFDDTRKVDCVYLSSLVTSASKKY